MSPADSVKVDVREHGAGGKVSDRRLFVQLQVFTLFTDTKPLVRALEAACHEAVLYRDAADPRGVAVLGLHEDPTFSALLAPRAQALLHRLGSSR